MTTPGPQLKKGRTRRRLNRISLVVIGACLVLVIAAQAFGSHGSGNRPPPAKTTSAAATAAPSASHSPQTVAHRKRRKRRPKPSPSVTSPVAQPTPAPAATCHPISDEGTCYEPGEYCRDDDHGMTGLAGDGETITCEDNDGWRWEPT